MSYCINPNCTHPENSDDFSLCKSCGSHLLIEGRYRVLNLLGKGGFGKTYEVDEGGNRKVLKVLTYNDALGVRLFQQEAHVLMQLRHPGLPAVESNGYFTFTPHNSQEPLHCLVMEKIAGVNLQQWLKNRSHQPISPEQAIDWLEQLANILHLVHYQNYFHRDIKPPNIMLRPNGQLVLIDFGAVRQFTETVEKKVGVVTRICSVGYTPPEQNFGNAEMRSDFFALGRTFVYLLTGQEPNHLEETRTGNCCWRTLARQVPKPLADLLDCLMAPSVEDRPKDTQELLQRLADLKNPSAKSERLFAFEVKKLAVGGGVGVAIAVAVAIAFTVLKPQPQKQIFLSYQNHAESFMLKYPEKWEKKEFVLDNFNRDAVKFSSPPNHRSPQSQEEVSVTIELLKSESMSLDEYTQFTLNELKKNFTNVTFLEDQSLMLANNPAHKVVFTGKEGEKSWKKMQVWTVKDNKAYILTYAAEPEEYPENSKIAEEIIDSFELNANW